MEDVVEVESSAPETRGKPPRSRPPRWYRDGLKVLDTETNEERAYGQVDAICREALYENDDCYSVVLLMSRAFYYIEHPSRIQKECAGRILRNIDDYYEGSVMGMKDLVSEDNKKRMKGTLSGKLFQKTEEKYKDLQKKGMLDAYLYVGQLIEKIDSHDWWEKDDYLRENKRIVVKDVSGDEIRKGFFEEIDVYGENDYYYEDLNKLFEILSLEDPLEGEEAGFENREFGGHTLKGLFRESDIGAFLANAKSYVASLPTDDLFWVDLTKLLLGSEMDYEIDQFGDKADMASKVLLLKYDIIGEYLMSQDDTESRKNTTLYTVSSKLNDTRRTRIITSLIEECAYAEQSVRRIRDKYDQGFSEKFKRTMLYQLIEKNAETTFGDGVKILPWRESLKYMYEVAIPQLVEDKLFKYPETIDLNTSFRRERLEDLDAKDFIDLMSRTLGKDFIDRIVLSASGLKSIQYDMFQSIQEVFFANQTNESTDELLHQESGSLAVIAELPEFRIIKSGNEYIHFAFGNKEFGERLAGKRNLLTGETQFSIDFQDHPELQTFFDFIATATIKDYFTDKSRGNKRKKKNNQLSTPNPEFEENGYTSIVELKGKEEDFEEKIAQIETLSFVKGETLEQLVGLILAYSNDNQKVIPQFCLEVDSDSRKFGTRVDFRVGTDLYEVKWGASATNINSTVTKHLQKMQRLPVGYRYHLIRFQQGEKDAARFEFERNVDTLLSNSIDNLHMSEIFEMLGVILLEETDERNVQNLKQSRDFFYNVLLVANKLEGEQKKQYIHDVLRRYVHIYENKSTEALNEFLENQTEFRFSPLDAIYEIDGQLFSGRIAFKEFCEENKEAFEAAREEKLRKNGGKYKIVPMHKQSLPGIEEHISQYQDLYLRYLDEEDENSKQTVLNQLLALRKNIYQPTLERIQKFDYVPESFRPDRVKVIVNGEEVDIMDVARPGVTLYRNNWHTEYYSPRVGADIMQDPELLYHEVYAQRSAGEFLNYLKNWIIEGIAEKENS